MEEICDYDIYTLQCKQCLDRNFLLKFFFLSSFLPFTLFFSSWVVAKFIFIPYQKKVEKEMENYTEPSIPYDEKYPITQINENENINYKINFVFETTPNGIVLMRYSKENEGFLYWCDDKQIPYKYLEVVARKFVNNFSCQKLYIDRKKEIEKQIKLKKNQEIKKKENLNQENKDNNSVFAKLKPKVETKSKVKNINVDVAIKGNKYKYVGKIKEFKFLNNKNKKEQAKNISFFDWKEAHIC